MTTDFHGDTQMPVETFDEMLALYGADLSRWPLSCVKTALALMAADDNARRRFDDVRRLDDDLRLADDTAYRALIARHGPTAPLLQDNVMRRLRGEDPLPLPVPSPAVIAATGPFARILSPLRAFMAPVGSLLMIGVIGFVMGVQQPASADDSLLDGLLHGQDIVIAGDQSLGGGL